MDVVAERKLFVTFADGQSSEVHLRIGLPRPHPEIDWVCPVSAKGLRLWQGPTNVMGIDSWQALSLAMRLMRTMLSAEVEEGATFHWEDGEHAIGIDDLFEWRART